MINCFKNAPPAKEYEQINGKHYSDCPREWRGGVCYEETTHGEFHETECAWIIGHEPKPEAFHQKHTRHCELIEENGEKYLEWMYPDVEMKCLDAMRQHSDVLDEMPDDYESREFLDSTELPMKAAELLTSSMPFKNGSLFQKSSNFTSLNITDILTPNMTSNFFHNISSNVSSNITFNLSSNFNTSHQFTTAYQIPTTEPAYTEPQITQFQQNPTTTLSSADIAQIVSNREYATLVTQVYMVLSAISILAIIVALITLIIIPNKAVRIYLHINLLLSFLIRYLTFVVHELIYNRVIGYEDMAREISKNLGDTVHYNKYVNVYEPIPNATWDLLLNNNCTKLNKMAKFSNYETMCQVYEVLLNFALTSNHIWTLIEGLYLFFIYKDGHMNMRKKGFNVSNQFLYNNAAFFVTVGWGVPLTLIVGWVCTLSLTQKENSTRCMTFSQEKIMTSGRKMDLKNREIANEVFINTPIAVGTVINSAIMIYIIYDLRSKLKTISNLKTQDRETPDGRNLSGNRTSSIKKPRVDERTLKRLTKATLSLIPLLNVHYWMTWCYAVFDVNGVDTVTDRVLFFIEALITSSQGVVVAALYGFASREVKSEVQKIFSKIKTDFQLKTEASRRGSDHRVSFHYVEGTNGNLINLTSSTPRTSMTTQSSMLTPSGSFVETIAPGNGSTSSSFSKPRVSQSNTRTHFESICEEIQFEDEVEEVDRLKTPLTQQLSTRTDRTDLDTNEADLDRDMEPFGTVCFEIGRFYF